MLTGIAALFAMVFLAYLIFQALNGKLPRTHVILYLLSTITALYSFIYFLAMDISFGIKAAASIILGLIAILIASRLRHHRHV